MKTLQTIITAVTLLFSISSFAQTKEETIAWIMEKLEKHGGFDAEDRGSIYINVSVSPCHISFTRKFFREHESSFELKYSFDPSAAKSWKVSAGKDGIIADAKIIQSTVSPSYVYNTLYIKNGEADIHERMIKALTYLATFCEKKPTN